jgi:homocysteine S-methyltransferase
VRAAVAAGVPVVASFTVEVDGRLPDGTPLADAIALVDAQTGGAAAFFMVNCAHPTHIARGLDAAAAPALDRIGGLRVNGSPLSHAELDAAETLDADGPQLLADAHAALRDRLPAVTLLGGCCGTDHRHVGAIVGAWADAAA